MEKIKKNFGFGCMRLPMINDEVDTVEFSKMIDKFIGEGFNYFDTAHGYLNGKSETAIRECLTKRYPRESYILTNKLSSPFFNSKEEILPLFESQLDACGVDYFDFYLMHAQSATSYAKFQKIGAYEEAYKLKEQGKIRHLGISFHDKAEVLDQILTEHPEVEIVQIQFNYLDYLDPAIQSKACYDVCRKHNKPIIVMEPVKGGSLVNMPADISKVLTSRNQGSLASYAIRFAAGHDGIIMVLSGMGNMDMMNDNLSYMKDFRALNDEELNAVNTVVDLFNNKNIIKCTACKYCVDGCPQNIIIPELFSCMNTKKVFNDWNADYYYSISVNGNGKASDCIKCGACEDICPQHLPIRDLMVEVANEFDNK